MGNHQTLVSGQGGLACGDREQKEAGEMETRGKTHAKEYQVRPGGSREP